MIRCLVFDFDGTLVPSNDIKRYAFTETVAAIPGGVAAIDDILRQSPGADRYAVFDALAWKLGNNIAPPELVDRYGEICEARIVPLIVDSGITVFLQTLSASGLDLHIATATPRTAIIATLGAAGITEIFKSVHGRPQSKDEAIIEIMRTGSHSPETVAVIGDSAADRAAAEVTGCHYVPVQPDASDLHGQSVSKAMRFLAARLTLPTSPDSRVD